MAKKRNPASENVENPKTKSKVKKWSGPDKDLMKKVALDLNTVMGLDPEIDVSLAPQALYDAIKYNAVECEPEDDFSDLTWKFLDSEIMIDFNPPLSDQDSDDEGADNAVEAPKNEKKPKTKEVIKEEEEEEEEEPKPEDVKTEKQEENTETTTKTKIKTKNKTEIRFSRASSFGEAVKGFEGTLSELIWKVDEIFQEKTGKSSPRESKWICGIGLDALKALDLVSIDGENVTWTGK